MGNPKAFLTIPRQEAGYRPIHDRISDYSEVEQTLNSRDRKLQASRCMDCGVPFCHWACPLGNKQPEFQDALYKGKWEEAYKILNETNDFPEFTGRICPALCEKSCVLKLSMDSPVTIRENEAAIAEAAFREGYISPRHIERNGRKVAIIGAGPAGLATANQLNGKGYTVTVFDKNEAPGGLLRYGIPNFKLHKPIIDRRILVTAKGKKVLIIGGGDTGSDCIGTSNRQGAASVTQIEIMPQPPVGQNPATPWPQFPLVLKTTSSHEEGCSRRWSLATHKFLGKNGKVCGVEVEQVEWIPNPDGDRPTMKSTGKIEVIETDLVLLAMGFLKPEHPQFAENVFVAGDAASGASLVVRAIASGRKAATDIDSYLNK